MISPIDKACETIRNPETIRMKPKKRLKIGTSTNYLIVLLVSIAPSNMMIPLIIHLVYIDYWILESRQK